jgi:AraC-like DNA-binding protein
MVADTFRHLTFRASARPSVPLPFSLRSAGHYQVSPEWFDATTDKPFCQLFWFLEGHGRIIRDGRRYQAEPGEIFIYVTGDRHDLRARTERWRYRFITLDGPRARQCLEDMGLAPGPFEAGPCPEDAFEQADALLRENTPRAERLAAARAFEICCRAAAREPVNNALPERPGYTQIREYLDHHYTEPGCDVTRAAAALGLHRATAFRAFRRELGLAPSEYLRRLRVQHALALLRQSILSIEAVARASGFADPNYFSRVIRRATGQAPSQFRRS